jgi:branched-chain amino acid transport system ATP-binding protein
VTDSATALLELDGVSKSFGRVVVADKLTFTVSHGEILGIVGPNGAGKTSLFGLISGELALDGGEIRFAGAPVMRLDAAARCRLGIGRTFQVPRPFGGLNVLENVLVAAQGGAACGARALPRRRGTRSNTAGAGEPPSAPACCSASGWSWRGARQQVAQLPARRGGRRRALPIPGFAESWSRSSARFGNEGVAVVWVEHVVLWPVRSPAQVPGWRAYLGEGEPGDVLANPTVREVFLGSEVTTSLMGSDPATPATQVAPTRKEQS